MKKVFCLIALCVMCFTSMATQRAYAADKANQTNTQATPSLIGTWVANGRQFMENDREMQEMFQKANLTFTFTATALSIGFDLEGKVEEEGVNMELGVKVNGKGTYKKSGNKISVIFANSKPTANLYKFKLNLDAETKAAMEAMGMGDEYFKKMFNQEIQKAGFEDMYKQIAGETTIKELTASTLILTDEKGIDMVFHRKK